MELFGGDEVGGAATNPFAEPFLKGQVCRLVSLSSSDGICGSLVGAGGKVCVKTRSECGTVNHTPGEMESGLYVQLSERHAMKGCLPIGTEKVFKEEISGIRLRGCPKGTLFAIFATLQNYAEVALSSTHTEEGLAEAEEETRLVLAGYIAAFPDLQVPAGLYKGGGSEWHPSAMTRSELTPMKRKSPEGESEALTTGKMKRQSEEDALDAVIEELKQDNMAVLRGLQLDVRAVAGLAGKLGPDDLPLASTVQGLEAQVGKLLEVIQDVLGTQAGQSKVMGGAQAAIEVLEGAIKSLMVKLSSLADSHNEMGQGARVDKIEATLNQVTLFCEELLSQIQDLTGKVTASSTFVTSASQLPPATTAGRHRHDSNAQESLEILKDRVIKVEKEHATSRPPPISIDKGRWKFDGKKGVDKFLKENGVDTDHFPFEQLCLAYDPVCLLQASVNDGTTTTADFQKEEVHHVKTARSPMSTSLAAASRSTFPACLAGAKSDNSQTVSTAHTMSKIKSYEVFNNGDGSTGIYDMLLKNLDEVQESELVRLEEDLRDYPELQRLASFLLTSTKAFTVDLFRWVNTHYTTMLVKLTVKTKEESEACWQLQLTMLRTVWETLWEHRKLAQFGHTLSPRMGLITYFHTALLTHVSMMEFRKGKFSEHQAIFPKLITFLFQSHTPRVEYLALKKMHNELSTKVIQMQKEREVILQRLAALDGGKVGGGKWGKKKEGADL